MIKNKTIVMSQSDFSSQGELFALTETAFIVLDKQLVLHYYNEYAARLCELPKEFSSSIQLTSPFYTLPIPNPIIDTHGELISENKNSAHYWIKINLLVNKKTYIGLVRKKKTTDFLSKNKLLQKIEKKLGYIPKKITTENDVIDVLSLHYQSIIDKLPYYIYWKNTQSEYQGCNKMTRKLLGLNSPKEIIGKTDIDFFGSTELAYKFQDQDKEVFLSKKSLINVKEDLKNNQGVLMNTLINKVPLFHGDEVIGLVGVTIDVTELVQAKKLAEAANLAKTEFIANMSHDIRTPLTGVIGLSEILEQTLQNPEEKEKAHLLHDSGEELLHMLNDILDDVRAGNLKETDLKEEAFSLHQCIKDLIRLQSPATTLKGLALKADIAANVPQYIRSDRNKIHRILLNLMGNAIKFTQSGCISLGVDCLHCDGKEAHLKFSVSDTGIGIPEEAQAQVFNRFFKVTSSYKGLYEGHGLGLHIAQSYVELLGGHITLTSTVGVGTTFHFDIVCALAKPPVDLKPEHPLPSSVALIKEQSLHLLLVEDNLVALKTLEFMLKQKGYTFASAASGEEAWNLLQQESFDLMITDIGLPGISGNQLSLRIRNQEMVLNKPPLPIIGLTGHAKEAALDECLQNGMNDVFSKPASIDTLHSCIQKLVQKAKTSKEKKSNDAPEKPSLGIDLPNTEEELFQLDTFPLFNEAQVLSQIGDKQLLITLVNAYLSDDMQNDIKLIQTQYQQGNWEEVEKLAHKIKGGVAYLGTQRMRYACQYLERYYKAGHRALLEPLYQQLISVSNDTNQMLFSWLQNSTN